MRRMTFTLSDDTANLLDTLAARVTNGNASLLADLALKRLIRKPMDETQRLVNRHMLDRMASTRGGWMRAFWQTLGELMGQPDPIENVRAPRRFEGFYAALLMHHVAREDEENDPFHPHIGPQPVLPDSPQPHQWTFERTESPVAAAEAVAAKLRDYGASISTSERN